MFGTNDRLMSPAASSQALFRGAVAATYKDAANVRVWAPGLPPRVRHRAGRVELLGLYKLWGNSDRLMLLPVSSSQALFRGAVATTYKDAVADRCTLTRMPENTRQDLAADAAGALPLGAG